MGWLGLYLTLTGMLISMASGNATAVYISAGLAILTGADVFLWRPR